MAEKSPSSRRAWIEITSIHCVAQYVRVALLAEGVDRNPTVLAVHGFRAGRPPRGGRG